jgi:hypothetical protein
MLSRLELRPAIQRVTLSDEHGLGERAPALLLLEHHLTRETEEGAKSRELVRIGADSRPNRPASGRPEDNPRHAELELWIANADFRGR